MLPGFPGSSYAALIKILLGTTLIISKEPRILFRGQHCDSNEICSKLPSISFGSSRVASIYALNPNNNVDIVLSPKVFPVYLEIVNPIVNTPKDPFIELGHYAQLLGNFNAVRLAIKFATWITMTDNWADITKDLGKITVSEYLSLDINNLNNLYLQLYPILDDPEEVELLRNKGFDGAIYGGSGASAGEAEYRVFDKHQYRSIYKN